MTEKKRPAEGRERREDVAVFELGSASPARGADAGDPGISLPASPSSAGWTLGVASAPAVAPVAHPAASGAVPPGSNPVPVFDLGGAGPSEFSAVSAGAGPERFDLGQSDEAQQKEFVREQVLASQQMYAEQAMALQADRVMQEQVAAQTWSLGEQSQAAQQAVAQEQFAQQTDQAHAAFQQSAHESLLRAAQEQASGQADGGQSLLHAPENMTRDDAAQTVQDYSTAVHFDAGMNATMNAVFHNMGH